MKYLIILLLLIFLASCSKMGIEKRRYQAGYYHENCTKEKVANRILTAKQDKKKTVVKNTYIYKDTNIVGIVLPLKDTVYNKNINKPTLLASVLPIINEAINKPSNDSKVIDLIQKSNKKNKRVVGTGGTGFGSVTLIIFCVVWLLLIFALELIFPKMGGGVAVLIGLGCGIIAAIMYYIYHPDNWHV
jgi:hypothetical protein